MFNFKARMTSTSTVFFVEELDVAFLPFFFFFLESAENNLGNHPYNYHAGSFGWLAHPELSEVFMATTGSNSS
jgi:hypothetical protein